IAPVSSASMPACAAATATAPTATSVQTRTSPTSPGRARRTRNAKRTPPIATAWPVRARPRRMTSANAATSHGEIEGEEGKRGRAHGADQQEPPRVAERRQQHDDVDEIAAGQGAGQAAGPRL